MVEVAISVLDPTIALPTYAMPGDAGMDLRAREDVAIPPGGGRATIPTGLVLGIPEGYAGFVLPRSGLAQNHGITCLNTPGLIDSGYRGEIKVVLINTDPYTKYTVAKGDRIAQLVIMQVEQVVFSPLENLAVDNRGVEVPLATKRGDGGFGHTGR